MSPLTAAQKTRLQEVFDELDTDGSDDLDYTELKAALQTCGVDISLAELKKIWIRADKDASSGISFDEFVAAVENLDDPNLRDKLTKEDGSCTVM
jgi:Ca2+-binding EF-hand superfamily protein